MSPSDPLSELTEDSICFSSQTQMVRLDEATTEVEQSYLKLKGTPKGFRWLARQLIRMADSVNLHKRSSVIVASRDFSQQPVSLDGWFIFESRKTIVYYCQRQDRSGIYPLRWR